MQDCVIPLPAPSINRKAFHIDDSGIFLFVANRSLKWLAGVPDTSVLVFKWALPQVLSWNGFVNVVMRLPSVAWLHLANPEMKSELENSAFLLATSYPGAHYSVSVSSDSSSRLACGWQPTRRRTILSYPQGNEFSNHCVWERTHRVRCELSSVWHHHPVWFYCELRIHLGCT